MIVCFVFLQLVVFAFNNWIFHFSALYLFQIVWNAQVGTRGTVSFRNLSGLFFLCSENNNVIGHACLFCLKIVSEVEMWTCADHLLMALRRKHRLISYKIIILQHYKHFDSWYGLLNPTWTTIEVVRFVTGQESLTKKKGFPTLGMLLWNKGKHK